jgi:hypothetical protein
MYICGKSIIGKDAIFFYAIVTGNVSETSKSSNVDDMADVIWKM